MSMMLSVPIQSPVGGLSPALSSANGTSRVINVNKCAIGNLQKGQIIRPLSKYPAIGERQVGAERVSGCLRTTSKPTCVPRGRRPSDAGKRHRNPKPVQG